MPIARRILTALQIARRESVATRVSVMKFSDSSIGNGVVEAANAIMDGAAATAYANQVLWLPEGYDFACGTPLLLPENTKIDGPGARLLRYCATTGNSGFIGGSNTVKANNVRLSGFEILGDTQNYAGNVIALFGDDNVIDRVKVNGYGAASGGGRAMFLRGDNMRLYGPWVINPRLSLGVGGIRYAGGSNMRCYGAHVISGDDAFQLVPGASDNRSILGARYIGGTGGSYFARLMTCGLTDPNSGNTTQDFVQPAVGANVQIHKTTDNRYEVGVSVFVATGGFYTVITVDSNQLLTLRNDGDINNAAPGATILSGSRVTIGGDDADVGGSMTASITDSGFYGIDGFARGIDAPAITVRNNDSSGTIDNITFRDLSVDCAGSTSLDHLFVEGNRLGAFPVGRITVDNVRLRNPYGVPLHVVSVDTYGGVGPIHVSNSEFDKSTLAGPAARITGANGGSITRSKMSANADNVVQLGATGKTTTNFTVDTATLLEIPNGSAGVQLNTATSCRILNTKFVRIAGATTSQGVGGSGAGNYIGENDFTSVDTAVSSATLDVGSTYTSWGCGLGASTATIKLRIAPLRTGDGDARIELWADSSGAFSFQFNRNSTANGIMVFEQSGTGAVQFKLGGNVKVTFANNGTVTVASGGVNITAGGMTVTAGGLTVSSGGASITGGLTVVTSGLTVTAGGFTLTAGNFKLPALSNFLNDAAAQTGGIAVNQVYRNGSIMMQRVS